MENRFDIKRTMDREVDLGNMNEFLMTMSGIQRRIVEQEQVQKLLSDPEQNFDLVILEWLAGEYITGIAAVFGCPYIWLSSFEPDFLMMTLIGEYTGLAYVPTPVFSSLQRMWSMKRHISAYLFREFYIQQIEEIEYQRVFAPLIAKRHKVIPSYSELRYNASLILGNSHNSVGKVIQLPQAYKAIGGYHIIKKNIQPLPKDLKNLMDRSTNGVIYFSMGTFLPGKSFPDEIKQRILKVFAGLKQTVLWKFETDLPNRPSNVHIISWSPQQSILDHPNCVLFISHGGQLSSLEALHFGVPLIGIPVFADQHMNVKTLVNKGVAKEVHLSYDMAEDLKAAIEEVLGNASYAEAVKHYSYVYHHRTAPPGAELVHWVEHVVQTRGALHLRAVYRMMPWYQKCYLDVASVAIAVVIFLILATKWLFRKLKTFFVNQISDLKKKQ
ncbi:UDP-glucosyltransferase 2-like isoform X2 [Epargyreus clarus]